MNPREGRAVGADSASQNPLQGVNSGSALKLPTCEDQPSLR